MFDVGEILFLNHLYLLNNVKLVDFTDDNMKHCWCSAERSKVLNEEQEDLERRVDLLRLICQNVAKKVQGCLNTQGQTTDAEKRMVN